MRCNKCKAKAIKNVNHKHWCNKCLNKFLRSREAQSQIIASWNLIS